MSSWCELQQLVVFQNHPEEEDLRYVKETCHTCDVKHLVLHAMLEIPWCGRESKRGGGTPAPHRLRGDEVPF